MVNLTHCCTLSRHCVACKVDVMAVAWACLNYWVRQDKCHSPKEDTHMKSCIFTKMQKRKALMSNDKLVE